MRPMRNVVSALQLATADLKSYEKAEREINRQKSSAQTHLK